MTANASKIEENRAKIEAVVDAFVAKDPRWTKIGHGSIQQWAVNAIVYGYVPFAGEYAGKPYFCAQLFWDDIRQESLVKEGATIEAAIEALRTELYRRIAGLETK